MRLLDLLRFGCDACSDRPHWFVCADPCSRAILVLGYVFELPSEYIPCLVHLALVESFPDTDDRYQARFPRSEHFTENYLVVLAEDGAAFAVTDDNIRTPDSTEHLGTYLACECTVGFGPAVLSAKFDRRIGEFTAHDGDVHERRTENDCAYRIEVLLLCR